MNATIIRGLALAFAVVSLGPTAALAEGLKAVVFDLEPVEMEKTPQTVQKMKTYSDLARKLLTEKGITIVDTAPQTKKIEDNLPLSQCNGCDQDIAKALGADIEVTLAVQPSSSVIFNLSGNVKDVATNRVLREGVVDIRGEGDPEWSHGVKFLVKERLTDPALPTDQAGLKKMVEDLPKPE